MIRYILLHDNEKWLKVEDIRRSRIFRALFVYVWSAICE